MLTKKSSTYKEKNFEKQKEGENRDGQENVKGSWERKEAREREREREKAHAMSIRPNRQLPGLEPCIYACSLCAT
jgi:hypothetical protein